MGYLYFYNPIWLAVAVLRRKSKVGFKPAGMQVVGMLGLIQSIRRTFGWALRLKFCKIERRATPPVSPIPLRTLGTECASGAVIEVTVAERPRVKSVPLPVAT